MANAKKLTELEMDAWQGFLRAHATITRDMSRALEDWAYHRGVQLDFIRPGKPTENGHIKSFNGRLRDECPNVNQFVTIDDARATIEAWREDSYRHRPHSSLRNLTPHEFARQGQFTSTAEGSNF